MRPFASLLMAAAALIAFAGTGQGQYELAPEMVAQDDAGLPSQAMPPVPRVWFPASSMMTTQYLDPYLGGPVAIQGYSAAAYPAQYGAGEYGAGEYGPAPADPYYDSAADGFHGYLDEYGDAYPTGCSECHGAGCDACSAEERFWLPDAMPFRGYARFEYLYWTPRGYDVPALVTTSPQGTPQAVAGRLGQPTTTVLFGGESISDEWRSGGRATVGIWLTPDQLVGLEASYLRLENWSESFQAASMFSGGVSTDPILARPFYDVVQDQASASLVAFPDFNAPDVHLDGAIEIQSHAMMESAELMRRDLIWLDVFDAHGGSFVKIYFLSGYRFFRLDEELAIRSVRSEVGGFQPLGGFERDTDVFSTETMFHGGQIGLFAEYAKGPLGVELLLKCGLGNSHQVVDNFGSTLRFSTPTDMTLFEGGLLTQPTSIGRNNRDVFAVIPEAAINVSLQVTCHVKLVAGYTFLYYSNVVRPGGQIDPGLDTGQNDQIPVTVPDQDRPGSLFENSEYWIHGFNAGVEICW